MPNRALATLVGLALVNVALPAAAQNAVPPRGEQAINAARTASAAPAAANATVVGSVVDADGAPVPGASVRIEGTANAVFTDATGAFTLSNIALGAYTLIVTRSGFQTARQSGTLLRDAPANRERIALAQASFSSLRVIGQTSTSGRARIDTTPAAVAVIPGQAFADQGQVQIANVLSETPGVITTRSEANGASQGAAQVTQVRGALPYETESLIDGHPLSVGSTGIYDPLLINPGLLQEVEVIKGPGSFASEINSAIGGTVNYRTLMPTQAPRETIDIGTDQYGGVSTTVRATGSIPNHFIDYAFGIATNGTTGPLDNYPLASSTTMFDNLGSAPYSINGRQIASPTTNFAPSTNPAYAGYPGQIRLAQPLYFCCSPLSTYFHQDGELAKLRLNFAQQTALTLTYLGGQAAYAGDAASLGSFDGGGIHFFNFVPPAGYRGSVAAGASAAFDNYAGNPQLTSSQANLFEAEFHTALGPVTVLARAYGGSDRTVATSGSTSATRTLEVWGGVLTCSAGDTATSAGGCNLPSGAPGPAPIQTYFNGKPVVIAGSGSSVYADATQDHLHGYSVELDRPLGAGTFSISFDRSNHDSSDFLNAPLIGVDAYQLAPGSGQQFTTVTARVQLAVAKNVALTIADYAIDYASHYSGDGGATWSDASQHFNAPRFALTARPNADTALRLSLGGSLAPPYISLLSAPAGPPVPDIPGAPTYYTQNVNNGQIRPETAFGYDLGFDRRVGRRLTLSADVYLTDLRDSFLTQTYQAGSYQGTDGAAKGQRAPLYITKTANLGHARYEGVELTIERAPPAGFGFRVAGALMRAYPYDVPDSLYATSSGPYTTNLAVIPNVNFQPSGTGFNGAEDFNAGGGRVPYAQGYAEVSYRTKHAAYANLGVTYYGNNNTYNNPPFGVVTASLRYPLGAHTSLQVSGFNLTQAYAQPYNTFFGGIPVPLVNGTHGATAGYLGAVESGNVGPATYRLIVSRTIGR